MYESGIVIVTDLSCTIFELFDQRYTYKCKLGVCTIRYRLERLLL